MNIKNLLNGNITQKELLNYYNSTILYYELPMEIKGFVFSYDNINFIIINSKISYYMRRKTLLHELAHIELNQLCQVDKDLFAFKVDKYEDEADKYIKFILESLEDENLII